MSSSRQAIIPRVVEGYAVCEGGVLMLIFASTLALAVMQILRRDFFDVGMV